MNDAAKTHARAAVQAARDLAHHLFPRKGSPVAADVARKFEEAVLGQRHVFNSPNSPALPKREPFCGNNCLYKRLQHTATGTPLKI